MFLLTFLLLSWFPDTPTLLNVSESEKTILVSDTAAVQNVIASFFEGMRKSDTAQMRATLHPGCALKTVIRKPDGSATLQETTVERMLNSIAMPHDSVYDERIHRYDIKVDAQLAIAWTPYSFYRGTAFSHCGVNVFQLIKKDDQWVIFSIADTRRSTDCESN